MADGTRKVVVHLLLHEYVNRESNDQPWDEAMVRKWLIDFLPGIKDGGLIDVVRIEFPDGTYDDDEDDIEWTPSS